VHITVSGVTAYRDTDYGVTVREREILLLLAEGKSNAAISRQLFITRETVKSHVRHILIKLRADSRAQAVAIALREGIID
jgi:two-component system, NarL family, response regulator LiaR